MPSLRAKSDTVLDTAPERLKDNGQEPTESPRSPETVRAGAGAAKKSTDLGKRKACAWLTQKSHRAAARGLRESPREI